MEGNDNAPLLPKKKRSPEEIRNLIGFWILGLTNNFAYMVMLSSAHDILTPANMTNVTAENRTGRLVEHCNPMGTGVILLADILPALIIKLMAPLALQRLPYLIRVCCVILFSLSSFILVAMGSNIYFTVSIIGVVCASAAAGLGETTYLGLMSHFDKSMVSTWSSGTGAAGVLATVSYAGILALGVSPGTTLMIMTVVPVIMALSYFILLIHPSPGLLDSPSFTYHLRHHYRTFSLRRGRKKEGGAEDDDPTNQEREKVIGESIEDEVKTGRSWSEKAKVLKPLAKYMVPLFFVYLLEYFINQALYELIQFNNSWLELHEQYRWYLAIYQVGAFVARSSVNLVHIRRTWIFPIAQTCVCLVLLLQVFFKYIPYILIIFLIVIIEGLISGGAYVNTFYSILNYMDKQDQELATSITTTSDSLGITLAALIATQVHNSICSI